VSTAGTTHVAALALASSTRDSTSGSIPLIPFSGRSFAPAEYTSTSGFEASAASDRGSSSSTVHPGSVTREDTAMPARPSTRSTASAGTSLSATTATLSASGSSGSVVKADVKIEVGATLVEPVLAVPPCEPLVHEAPSAVIPNQHPRGRVSERPREPQLHSGRRYWPRHRPDAVLAL